MKSGIYRIFNKVNGRSYIGSATKDWRVRIRTHFWNLRRGSHHSPAMQGDWNTMGSIGFGYEFLEPCDPLLCEIREAEFMERFHSLDPLGGYNKMGVAKKGYSGKKRGPKSSGVVKVVFYRRVIPSMVSVLDEVLRIGGLPVPLPVEAPKKCEATQDTQSEVNELKRQNMAVADDLAKITKERDELLAKRENWMRSTESQHVRFWINKHDAVVAAGIKGEYDQSI